MTRIERIELVADATGTLELICERSGADDPVEVRNFTGTGEFGLLADDVELNEAVALFVECGALEE